MRSVLVLVPIVLSCAALSRAGPPSASMSDVDPCIVNCPAGDSVFVIIARHADGVPAHPDEETQLDLCACPGVRLAPVADGAPYWVSGCSAWTVTDVNGIARFPLEAGGLCSGAIIRVLCGGVLLRFLNAVASFDQDADLVVDGADLALVDGKLGTSDPTADFDCDGAVTASDRDIAAAHVGHYHASIVGVGDGPGAKFGARPAPNPARGAVDFILRTPVRGRARLAIHDLAGRRLATVLDREIEPGVHRATWSSADDAGRPLPAGLYFYRLTMGPRRSQGMLVLTR